MHYSMCPLAANNVKLPNNRQTDTRKGIYIASAVSCWQTFERVRHYWGQVDWQVVVIASVALWRGLYFDCVVSHANGPHCSLCPASVIFPLEQMYRPWHKWVTKILFVLLFVCSNYSGSWCVPGLTFKSDRFFFISEKGTNCMNNVRRVNCVQ